MTWPQAGRPAELIAPDMSAGIERTVSAIRGLSPTGDAQSDLKRRALDLGETLLESRWALLGSVGSAVLTPFITVLMTWLTVTFASFGLFAPRNATVLGALFLSALSVAGAVFLVLELDSPFDGLVTVSAEPLRLALSLLRR